jgi:4-cresol dehydrogenase (hydroxylating) flavoprotein subunit
MSELSKKFERRVSQWLRPGGVAESLCGYRRERGGVLVPETVEDVQKIVGAAAKARGVVRLQPISCGKNWGFGSALPTRNGVYLLALSQLRRIRTLDLLRHYAELEPGVTQGTLDDALRVHGDSHYFNVTGAGLGTSVIGNALERGIGYSGQRHLDLLDLEVVLPTGELVRTSRFSTHSQAAAYLGGLGPDPTGLFFQSNFGVVTAATVALQRRPEVMGGVVCHLDKRDQFPELVSIISNLLAEGACYGVPHLFNRERVITTLSPHLEEGRAAELRSQAAAWMAVIPIKGCKTVFEALAQQLRDLLQPLGRIEVLTSESGAGVSRLLAGRPADLALASVAFAVFDRSAPLNAPVEASGAGLIHVTPIVPLCGKSVLDVEKLTGKVLRRHGYGGVPMSVNALSARTAALIVSLGFDRRRPDCTRAAHAAAEDLLRTYLRAGLMPYRLGLQQGELLPSMHAPWRRVLLEMQRIFDASGCMAASRYEPVWSRKGSLDELPDPSKEECLCLE